MKKFLRLLALTLVLAAGLAVGTLTAPDAQAKPYTVYTCDLGGSTCTCCFGWPCICDGGHHNVCQ